MSDKENTLVCQGSGQLIFACSGAADVGALSDLAARQLTKEGKGRMFCLAGIGGRVDPILKQTHEAASVLAIDGCSLDCVRKTLEKAGFKADHFRITDLGFQKGKTPVHDEHIQKIVNFASTLL